MDPDGGREDSGRGGRELQALLGAPMAVCSGCAERDGGIGHGKRRSRTGTGASLPGRSVGRMAGQLQTGRQAGSGRARSRDISTPPRRRPTAGDSPGRRCSRGGGRPPWPVP